MALKFALACAILLFPSASATNDHKAHTIEVHPDGRGSSRRSSGGASVRTPEAGQKIHSKESVKKAASLSSAKSKETSAKSTAPDVGAMCSMAAVVTVLGTKVGDGSFRHINDQMVNACPGAMHSGTSCTPACEPGTTGFGSIQCLNGAVEIGNAKCAKTCEIQPPINGGLGNCPNSMVLEQGTDCQFSCEVQYHPTGLTECLADDAGLNEAQCVHDGLINQAYDKSNKAVEFIKMADISEADASTNKATAGGEATFKFKGNFDSECYFIKAPILDGITHADEVQLTIKVAGPVTVFVVLPAGNDQRIQGFERWAWTPVDGGSSEHGWVEASTVLIDGRAVEGPKILQDGEAWPTSGPTMLYRKNFNTEEIMLPGNHGCLGGAATVTGGTVNCEPWEKVNYLTFVCPQDGSHCAEDAVGDVFPEFAKSPNQNSVAGCDGRLEVHSSCSPECTDGYFPTGQITCTLEGLQTTARCESNDAADQACPITSIEYGKLSGPENTCKANEGSAGALLPVGGDCVPACDAGYQVQGKFTCEAGSDGEEPRLGEEAACTPVVSSSSLLDAPETPKNKRLMRAALNEEQVH